MWHKNILEVIGSTPLVRLNRIARGLRPTVLAKLEYLNPGGSVKDRIGITMLEAAEKAGAIKPAAQSLKVRPAIPGWALRLRQLSRATNVSSRCPTR
jgi:hypothetical protein